MKNAYSQTTKDKPFALFTQPKLVPLKQSNSKKLLSRPKKLFTPQEIKLSTQTKPKSIQPPKKMISSDLQIPTAPKTQANIRQYLTNSKKTSPNNKVSLQFNNQIKNKNCSNLGSLMSISNTPKSTNCDTPKAKTLPNMQMKPIPSTSDNKPSYSCPSDEGNNGNFIQEILKMCMCFQGNGNNDNDTKQTQHATSEANEIMLQLQKKIDIIEYNTLFLSQTMLSSSSMECNKVLIDSTIRTETYHVYFDFMFKLLADLKSLLLYTQVNNQMKYANILTESNMGDDTISHKDNTSCCNIEDSQLNEKSNIIVPIGNAEIPIGHPDNNTYFNRQDPSISLLISSIHSEFYQKLIEDSMMSNNNNLFIDNEPKTSNKNGKNIMITSNQMLNQLYSKIITQNNNTGEPLQHNPITTINNIKGKTHKRNGHINIQTVDRQPSMNMFDTTPNEFFPQNSAVSIHKTIQMNDHEENANENCSEISTRNNNICIQEMKPTKPITSINHLGISTTSKPLILRTPLKLKTEKEHLDQKQNCIIM